jgi:hypothetical protein
MGIKTPMRPMDIRIPIEYGEVLMPHAKETTCFVHYHHDQMQYGAGRWKELCFFFVRKIFSSVENSSNRRDGTKVHVPL